MLRKILIVAISLLCIGLVLTIYIVTGMKLADQPQDQAEVVNPSEDTAVTDEQSIEGTRSEDVLQLERSLEAAGAMEEDSRQSLLERLEAAN